MSHSPSTRRNVVLGALLVFFASWSGGTVRADFTGEGWITDWLVFGPLWKSGLETPAERELRLDYLSDGVDVFESTALPREGVEVRPDFQGASAADGFHPVLGEPAAAAWRALDTTRLRYRDTVDFFQFYGAGERGIDHAVAYAAVYLENAGGESLQARMELASDDSILVKLDDCEVFSKRTDRPFGREGTVQDRAEVEITPGPHRLLVKAFNNRGAFGFRLRFVDRLTGEPLTAASTPSLRVELTPEAFGLEAVEPVGLVLERSVEPELALGTEGVFAVAIATLVTYAEIDERVRVRVEERLPRGTFLEAGSARPAPASVDGEVVRWELDAGGMRGGIRYEVGFEGPVAGCIEGAFGVGEEPGCRVALIGSSCLRAQPREGILLGDLVGGGDGRGTQPPEIVGINIRTGRFERSYLGMASGSLNLVWLAPVEESPWIDSVFFLVRDINSAGVQVEFADDDINGNSWDHILANRSHNFTRPGLRIDRIRMGGREVFATAVGIHAAAGVTFDLDALRETYGRERVVTFSTLAGMEDVTACMEALCARSRCGTVSLHVLFSDESDVLREHTWRREFASGEAALYEAWIPEEARFLTIATGRNGTGGNCAHGVFADPVIVARAPRLGFRRGDADASGEVTLSDAIFTLNHLFLGGGRPGCLDAADADDDGELTLSDGLFVLNYLFAGEEAPPAPGPEECGHEVEPSLDALDCEVYEGCE